MKRRPAMTGVLGAAIVMIVLVLAPSLARAHGGHDHHFQATTAIIDEANGVTPAERQATRPAAEVSVGVLDIERFYLAAHCKGGCCTGASCTAGTGIMIPAVAELIPPRAGTSIGSARAPPLSGLPTDGPRRPPKSFI